jgi:hypothetical protein
MLKTLFNQWVFFPILGSVLFSTRLLVELIFPFIPFKSDNCFLRIISEMPFYYAVAWVMRLFYREQPYWGMVIAIAILETSVICCIVWIVWKIFLLFTRTS